MPGLVPTFPQSLDIGLVAGDVLVEQFLGCCGRPAQDQVKAQQAFVPASGEVADPNHLPREVARFPAPVGWYVQAATLTLETFPFL